MDEEIALRHLIDSRFRSSLPRFGGASLAAEPTTAIRIALARKEGMSFRKSIADRVP
jgi:hypothetical protein